MPSHADLLLVGSFSKDFEEKGEPSLIDQYMWLTYSPRPESEQEQELIYLLSKHEELSESLEQIKREIINLYDHIQFNVLYQSTSTLRSGWTNSSRFWVPGCTLRTQSTTDTSGIWLGETRRSAEPDGYGIYLEGLSTP